MTATKISWKGQRGEVYETDNNNNNNKTFKRKPCKQTLVV